MTNLATLKERIEQEYNYGIEVYDFGDFIKVTNGSAAHEVRIRLTDGECEFTGRRDTEQIEKSCAPNPDAVIETLSQTI